MPTVLQIGARVLVVLVLTLTVGCGQNGPVTPQLEDQPPTSELPTRPEPVLKEEGP